MIMMIVIDSTILESFSYPPSFLASLIKVLKVVNVSSAINVMLHTHMKVILMMMVTKVVV